MSEYSPSRNGTTGVTVTDLLWLTFIFTCPPIAVAVAAPALTLTRPGKGGRES